MVLAWLTGDSTRTTVLTTTSNVITKGSLDDTINEAEAAALASLPRTLSSALRPSTQVTSTSLLSLFCVVFVTPCLYDFDTSFFTTCILSSPHPPSFFLPFLLFFSTGSCHHRKCSSLSYHSRQRRLGRSLWLHETRSSWEDFGDVTGSRYNLSHTDNLSLNALTNTY